jgi:glycerophosphoryl diester phosphodiesterase
VTPRLLRGDGPLIRVGHRGAAALAPENTLRSFAAAVALGVDAVELDVLAAGGRLVVAHDAASAGDASPTLDEALAWLAAREGLTIHVDLKLTERLDEVADALRRHGVEARTVVSSAHVPSLAAIRRAGLGVATGLTFPEDRLRVARRRGAGPLIRGGTRALQAVLPRRVPALLARSGADALMLHHRVVSPAAVARAHRAGAAVWAWTVDDPAELARVEAAGVDAVITNDPRIFAATLPA